VGAGCLPCQEGGPSESARFLGTRSLRSIGECVFAVSEFLGRICGKLALDMLYTPPPKEALDLQN
jgi:hypothetical protein